MLRINKVINLNIFSLVFVFVFLLCNLFLRTISGTFAAGDPNPGAIWTTNLGCVGQQDVNHYNVGETVSIRGNNFIANSDQNWTITGQPGGASGDPGLVVAHGLVHVGANGNFCVDPAYTVQVGDWGEYTVDVTGANKNDNYQVSIGSGSPTPSGAGTPTPSGAGTPTPTPTSTSEPTNTPAPPGPPGPKVCDAKQPPAPLLLSVTRTSATTVLLKWAPVIPSTYYVISYGTDPNNMQFGVPNTGNTDNFTIGALNPNLNYYFRLMAVNECMPSDPSAILGTGGGVLGASTSKVLGASTDRLADTSSDLESFRAVLGLATFGTFFVTGVQFLHGKKEN